MTSGISSSSNMIVGVLIGIIILAGTVALGCALTLGRRRTEKSGEGQASSQDQAVAVKKEDKPPAAMAVEKKSKEPRKGFLSFGGRSTAQKVQVSAVTVTARPKETGVVAAPDKKVKEKTPRLAGIKTAKKASPENVKQHGPGLFGRKKEKQAAGAELPAVAAPVAQQEAVPPPDVDINKPFVMPAAARAPQDAQPVPAPEQPLPPVEPPAPAQPPQGVAPDTAGVPPPATEPEEEEEEEATDAVFNLFTDTEGEESEISQFAANFDDVSLDSLLGEGQGLLGRFKPQ